MVAGMNSSDLRPDQLAAIQERVGEMLHYIDKLRQRMQHKGFPDDDPLWIHASKVRDATQGLITELRQLRHGPPMVRYTGTVPEIKGRDSD